MKKTLFLTRVSARVHIQKNHGSKRITSFVETEHEPDISSKKIRMSFIQMETMKAKGDTSCSVESITEQELNPLIHPSKI